LVGISAPGNYGPDYKAQFDAIYPDLAERFGTLLFVDFLSPITAGRSLQEAQAFMQGDGIHPNAEGVQAVVSALGPLVLDLAERARSN
ncbi:MAG: arylesterase, partial [Pseudomonadota bacterium]